MNKLIFIIMAFVDVNFAKEQSLTSMQLNEQYRAISQELSFGTKNVRTYRTMMAEAEATKATIMGATTWIDQSREAKSIPDAQKNRDTTLEMGPTKGALFENSELMQCQYGCGW